MKINVNVEILDFDGDAIILPPSQKLTKDGSITTIPAQPFTIKMALQNVLLEQTKDDIGIQEKIKRYELALQINKSEVLDIKVEDVALLKKLVGERYNPLIVGRIFEVLDV